jgi:hypothetical protein
MTENELKTMSRKQLLELLLLQTQRADRLEAELKEANRRIRDKKLIENEAGSIAEASLKLNGIFEAAQAAASQYVENVRRLNLPEGANHGSSGPYSPPVWQAEERRQSPDCGVEAVNRRLEQVSERIADMKEKNRALDELLEGISDKGNDGNES